MNRTGELYACLYAKEFPAQAVLRLRPELRERPVVIIEGEPPLETVCSFNTKARYLGIVRRMTRVELDTFSSLIVLPRSQIEEISTHAVMLECAGAFSPRVEDRSDGCAFLCVIDIAGTEKLLGPPEVLARKLLRRVQVLGVSASVAISRNFYTALSYVRGSSSRIAFIAPCDEGPALAPLPLKVLDISSEHAETFGLWRIHTLGAMAALPEKELISRIGQEGRRLRQLARGELPHHFVPYEAKFELEERMELDTPVEELEPLLFVVNVMLEQLIFRVTARVLALASVTITLSLEGINYDIPWNPVRLEQRMGRIHRYEQTHEPAKLEVDSLAGSFRRNQDLAGLSELALRVDPGTGGVTVSDLHTPMNLGNRETPLTQFA